MNEELAGTQSRRSERKHYRETKQSRTNVCPSFGTTLDEPQSDWWETMQGNAASKRRHGDVLLEGTPLWDGIKGKQGAPILETNPHAQKSSKHGLQSPTCAFKASIVRSD